MSDSGSDDDDAPPPLRRQPAVRNLGLVQPPPQQPPPQPVQWGGARPGGNRAGPGGVGVLARQAPIAAPVQPIQPVDAIPADIAAWTDDMLRVLGWNSKRVEHGATNASLGADIRNFAADRSGVMAGMRQKQVDLDAAYTANGVWNSEQEMAAAQLRAGLTFRAMNGSKGELQGGSANPTFWVKGAPDPITHEDKQYIFKPAQLEPTANWMPPNGEAAREALAGRAAEQLRAFTGLDFHMPTTNVIAADRSVIADYTGDNVAQGPTIMGSLQEFSPNQGALRQNFGRQKNNIAPQECQNIAILDTIVMNVDRHAGNLLLDANGCLIPIDHGLSFPGAEAVGSNVLSDMATEKNALTTLPGAYEPFSALSLAGIADINADLMADALGAENQTISQVHPQASGTVSDESLAISRRATLFLKLAAPTLPPAVVQIAMGHNGPTLLDPGISDQVFTQRATTIIASYAVQTPALKALHCLSQTEQENIARALKKDQIMNPDAKWIDEHAELALAYWRGGAVSPRAIVPRPATVPPPLGQAEVAAEIAQVLPRLKLDRKNAAVWMAEWEQVRALATLPNLQAYLRTKPALPMRTLADALAAAQLRKTDSDDRVRAAKLTALRTAFPNTALANRYQETVAIKAWDNLFNAGGAAAVAAARLRHPTIPAPQDPGEALMLVLTPAIPPNAALLRRLDYLDSIVLLDPTIVAAPQQAAITRMRIDVIANQVPGNAADAVDTLVDDVVADTIDGVKGRFDAIRATLQPGIWDRLVAGSFTDLYAGKFRIPVADLRTLNG